MPSLVALLTPWATRVPEGLLPAAHAAALVTGLRPGDEVVLGAGGVVAGGVRLVPSRWWDSRVPRVVPSSGARPDLPPLPDAVEARAPDGFRNIDEVLSFEERKAIVRGYASTAGFAQSQVNKPKAA